MQGNLVGRGVLEFCDGAPPVGTFIFNERKKNAYYFF